MANHPQHRLLASSCWIPTPSRAISFSLRILSKIPHLGSHPVHRLLNQPSICTFPGLGSVSRRVIMFLFLQHFCAITASGITNWSTESTEVTLPKVCKGIGDTLRRWIYMVILAYSLFHIQVLPLLFFKLCTHCFVTTVGQTKVFWLGKPGCGVLGSSACVWYTIIHMKTYSYLAAVTVALTSFSALYLAMFGERGEDWTPPCLFYRYR